MPSRTDARGTVDGRTARRDRNRILVLDAVLSLFSEGILSPTPNEVARRSGVSLRSVYRYVEDRDDLIRAAAARRREQVARLFEIERLGQGTIAERIDALCRTRVCAYHAVAATARASRARAFTSDVLRGELDEASRQLSDQVAAQFAPELKALDAKRRAAVLAAADSLCQLETIELYREHRGRSTEQTISQLGIALRRLLGADT